MKAFANLRVRAVAMLSGALIVGAATMAQAEAVTLKLASIAPEKSVWTVMLVKYADRVKELSGGDVAIEVFNGGQLGNMSDTMSQTLRGRIDIWTGPSPVMASLAPELATITLPYQFDTPAQASCVMPKLFDATKTALEGKGQFLAFFPVGYNDISNVNNVRVPDDLAGQKIRTSPAPISNAVVKAFGANPVPMGAVETASALSTGLVTGGDSGLAFWYPTGQAKVAKYFLRTRHYHNTSGMIVGPQTWDKLTDAQKKVLVDATDVLEYAQLQAMLDGFEAKVITAAAAEGAIVSEPTEEELAKWRERGLMIWEPILGQIGDKGQTFNAIIQTAKTECSN